MNPHRPAVECAGGFTLVELVIVIALTGVVAVLASTMVGNQMLGYVDTARRAELMAKANMAMQHIARDLRGAVPYSIRVSGGSALEWVPVQSWGRYRKRANVSEDAALDFSLPDNSFEVFFGTAMPAIPANAQLVIGNTDAAGIDGINLYGDVSTGALVPAGSHVITPASVSVGSSGNAITLSPSFQFALASLASRFYVVNGAASYVCSGNTVTRFSGYALQKSQPVNAAAVPLSTSTSALLLDGVASCQFGYTAVDATYGMLSVQLRLQEGNETVTMTRMISIENRP